MKKILLIIGALFSLTTGAHAFDISDYTAYPPFLPRVTSPNILFLLDYSKSMVRPAYGACYKYGSNATTPSSYANCGSVLSGDRVFNHMTDDYSSTTAYYGYYDNGYGRRTDITSCNDSDTYTDACAFKYACSAGSYCSKDSGGSWNGNWLNPHDSLRLHGSLPRLPTRLTTPSTAFRIAFHSSIARFHQKILAGNIWSWRNGRFVAWGSSSGRCQIFIVHPRNGCV